MIDNKILRPGNLVRINHDYGFEEIIISKDNMYSSYDGIPISIDYLEKLGFSITYFDNRGGRTIEIMKDLDDILVRYNPGEVLNFTISTPSEVIAKVKVEFVHQLQNLILDITGKNV